MSFKYTLVCAAVPLVLSKAYADRSRMCARSSSTLAAQFSVPSDNVHMLKIIGTPEGRIFMCGKDGNVYELHYQATVSAYLHLLLYE